MKLMTKEIIKTLPPLYSTENQEDPVAVIKYFTPDSNWTFYILEGCKEEDGDYRFFSKVISPMLPEGELGYITLNELKKVRGPLGLPIERDLYFTPKKLSECK